MSQKNNHKINYVIAWGLNRKCEASKTDSYVYERPYILHVVYMHRLNPKSASHRDLFAWATVLTVQLSQKSPAPVIA